MQVGDFVNEFGFLLDGLDALELGGKIAHSGGIDALFVHAGGPIISDLLLDLGATFFFGSGQLHSFARDVEVPKIQSARGSPSNLIGRDGVGGEPLSARVVVEILAGVECTVGLVGVKVLQLALFGVGLSGNGGGDT